MRKYFFFILLTNLIFSCETSPEPDTHAELYVRYDADIKALKAEADFNELIEGKLGESKVFSSGVQFINSGMRTVELPGDNIKYSTDLSGALPKSLYFNWYGKKGKAITTPIQLGVIKSFEIEGSQLSLSNGFPISIETTNLDKSEKLVLSIVDSNGKGKNLETQGPTSKMRFKIPGSELAGLATGPAYIHVVRSKSDNTTNGNYTIGLTTAYYTIIKKVEIVE